MAVLAPDSGKAATLDGQEVVHAGLADIVKWEEGPDGTLYVYGRASTPEVDTDEQIVDSGWSGEALKSWLTEAPALRVQHNAQRDPAGSGVGLEVNRDGDGAHWIKGAVDEPAAKLLVMKRHLRAFSVGIARPVIERDPTGKARGGVIKGGKIVEVSLVDSPANRSCFLEIAKAAGDDGHAEFTGKIVGADLLTKDGEGGHPDGGKAKTVTVELPKGMSLSVKPTQLAKLANLKRGLEAQRQRPVLSVEEARAKVAVPEAAKAVTGDGSPGPDAAKGVLRDSERDSMPASDFAYVDSQGGKHLPVHDEGHVRSALGRFAQQEFESPAARKKAARKIVSRARGLGIDLAGHGNVVAAAKVAKVTQPQAAKKKGKLRAICPGCGARQNPEHRHCPECGRELPAAPLVTAKNHDFTCLGCGKTLDKGERFCPQCGKENPGYLPEADKKIPANQDKSGKARVAKGKKAKGKKGGTVGQQAPGAAGDAPGAGADQEKPAPTPPVGAGVREVPGGGAGKAAVAGESPKGAKGEAKKKARRGKKGKDGKKPPWLKDGDGDGDDDDAQKSAAPDSGFGDDPAVLADLRLKTLGVPAHLGFAHDATCPAFLPAETDLCYPGLSLKTLDIGAWQEDMLDKAASADLETAMGVAGLLDATTTLRAADPLDLRDLREGAHKAFRDANPGPSSFPTPTQISPQRFNRPYLSGGHAAASPGHDAPNSARLPAAGGLQPEDYRRGYLSGGHADESPANAGHSQAISGPDRTGVPDTSPSRALYRDSLRASDDHAMRVLHDHIGARFPALCPMHPHVVDRPVPVPQGVPPAAPVPGTAGLGSKKAAGPAIAKADRKAARAQKKARAAKAAARKARRKARADRDRIARQVLKGEMTVEEGQAKLGLPAPLPEGVKTAAGAPEPPVVTPLDAAAVAAAVKSATAPLRKRLSAQDKALKRQRKVLDAIAGQPDTSQAPYRGVALAKTSGSPAGTPAVAKSAAQIEAERYAALDYEFRTTTDPAAQAALARVLAPYWNPAMQNSPPT